jgi:N-methylhydantoinase B
MLYGRGNSRRFALVNAYAGGMGARSDRDGLSATGFPSGIRCTPVEVSESIAPIVVWRKEFRQDSGGVGQYRGGLGQTMEVGHLFDEQFAVSAMFERIVNAAAGRNGGAAGAAGRIRTSTGRTLNGKGRQLIEPGERLVLDMPGGGGFGAARLRALAAVMNDVTEGRVSRESAAHDYGVQIPSEGSLATGVDRGSGA